jgi:predicted nucleic acid-binding protein
LKKVFVDTNIIIDLIADRQPFSRYAIEIFTAAEQKKIKIFASSHSIATS